MKGIAHFMAGVAVASCVPEAVRAASAGDPAYFILGGVFGLLPDTVDFKFARYFYRHDVEVTPDPVAPEAQPIADSVAAAINRAAATGRCVRVKLNTIHVGLDRWRQYRVVFDVAARKVVVRIGPIVDTGQNVVSGEGEGGWADAAAHVDAEVRIDYQAETQVDIFDGPVFSMEPTADGRVTPRLIPWHRAWSHSLVVAALCGLAGWWVRDVWAGLVICGAMALHALLDQLGYMGSALWFPFQRGRVRGVRLMHSGAAPANLVAVWSACLLIFWNLWRAAPGGVSVQGSRLLILYGLALPVLVIGSYRRLRRRATRR